MADIVAVLYGRILRVDPANPRWPERDRFILSKGHAAAGLYGALVEKGFFPKEWIDTYYGDDGRLSGHISHHVPGAEFSTGSLGHGLPVAAGMALVAKRLKRDYRIFCLMSDGDCNEGSTWEAIMFAAQHGFDNLTAIVDANRIQALGKVSDIIDMEPFARKVEAFGWAVREIDGHDVEQIEKTLLAVPFQKGQPSFVIARTVKGKGVKSIENTVSSHYRCIPDEKLKEVYEELGVSDAFPV
jgi:transketolase